MRTIQTFYSIDALLEDVPSEKPVGLTPETVYVDLLAHLSQDGDFLGVIDETGTTLQVMYDAENDSYWIEIPDPTVGGSYGCKLSFVQVHEVFKNLPKFFSKTMIKGMEFQSWT
jgi:hypothetical protein